MKFQYHLLLFLFGCFTTAFAQRQPGKIVVENADFQDINQYEIPDAVLLTGNVRVSHEGVIMTCNKAYFFQKENYIKDEKALMNYFLTENFASLKFKDKTLLKLLKKYKYIINIL